MHCPENRHFRLRFFIQIDSEVYRTLSIEKKFKALGRDSHPVDKVRAIEILLRAVHRYSK